MNFQPVHWVVLVIVALLIAASGIAWIIGKKKPGSMADELKARIVSWWWMIAIFTIALFSSTVVSTIFLGLVAYLALKEFLSLIPTRRVDRSVLLFAYLAIPVQFYFAYIGSFGLFMTFIPVWLLLFIPVVMTLMGKTEGFLRAVGMISWGVMITAFSLSHLAMLLSGGDTVIAVDGPALLLFLVGLTQFNDVAQFTSGKLMAGKIGSGKNTGGYKIVPSVSPNKTWEGFLGGVVATTLAAALIGPYLTPMPLFWSALSGAIIAVAGFLGDVTISAFKRDLGVKDSGSLIPGHGGVLDRVDSLTYAAPVFYHFLSFFFLSGRMV